MWCQSYNLDGIFDHIVSLAVKSLLMKRSTKLWKLIKSHIFVSNEMDIIKCVKHNDKNTDFTVLVIPKAKIMYL